MRVMFRVKGQDGDVGVDPYGRSALVLRGPERWQNIPAVRVLGAHLGGSWVGKVALWL